MNEALKKFGKINQLKHIQELELSGSVEYITRHCKAHLRLCFFDKFQSLMLRVVLSL